MLKKLKEKRYEKKLTNRDMAERLGISKAFYCQIENGSRRLSYEMAIKIAGVFSMRPDKLFYNDFVNNEKEEK